MHFSLFFCFVIFLSCSSLSAVVSFLFLAACSGHGQCLLSPRPPSPAFPNGQEGYACKCDQSMERCQLLATCLHKIMLRTWKMHWTRYADRERRGEESAMSRFFHRILLSYALSLPSLLLFFFLEKCECDADHIGDDCSRHGPACPNDCSGKGTCFQGRCQCDTGLSFMSARALFLNS